MSMRHRCYPEEEPFEDRSQDETLGTLVTSPRKQSGLGPNILMGLVMDRDKAVITPLNKDAWIVEPEKKNVSSTITRLIKDNYPGTYRPLDQHGREVPAEDDKVIAHYRNYPSVTRMTILNEFLKRFKFAPGREEECTRLFELKAVERFSQALSYEKSRAKISLEKSMKERSAIDQSEQHGDALPEHHTDEACCNNGVNEFDAEDPQLWKPFPPSWIERKWWDMLCDLWSNANVMKVSAQNSQNRKNGGGVHHTCGSRSIAMHKQDMIIKNGGHAVDDLDVFARTHRHEKGKGQYVNRKAEQLVDVFNERTKEVNNNQIEKQNIWVQLTRGLKRGRYYGLPGIIDRDQISHSSSTPSTGMLNSPMQPLYTQQQVKDIVSQAVNNALRDVNLEFGTRIQSLEHRVDRPTQESHSHDVNGTSTCAVPDFLEALNMNRPSTFEFQHGQSGTSHDSDDQWRF
ncbi:hypothetical protein E2562_014766 [Oryza meyeriana var. granulata]|uniref:Uncharacterized protein n=1 Tax=Oryza meyeriana var. granulata TaxID=110450 RepID=A0A6G1BKS5_9ORYZ|nr:hypothetical protein E2562_014766 [Oryza meyeriana var. granulata]